MISFTGRLQLWTGSNGNVHFLSIPGNLADEIRAHSLLLRRGFGSVRVEVTVEDFTWRTSVFPVKSSNSYFLPVKMDVIGKTGIRVGDDLVVSLELM